MDFPILIDIISLGLPTMPCKGHRLEFPNYDVFLSLKIVLTSAKSEDPSAAFHLGLHSLPKYQFKGFQYTKG